MKNEEVFMSDLMSIINKHSIENGSNTPDFLLADYLLSCIKAYNKAVDRRAQWFRCDVSDRVFKAP